MRQSDITVAAQTIADVASRQSGKVADGMLMNLVEKGDSEALAVVRELPPSTKARILRDHDYTVPSIFGLLLEPEDVVDVMVGEPLTWLNAHSMSEHAVYSLVDDVRSILTSIILSRDDEEWQQDVLHAIEQSEEAVLFMAIAYAGCITEHDEHFHFDFPEGDAHGTIGHLHTLLEENESLSYRIASMINKRDDASDYQEALSAIIEAYEAARLQTMEQTAAAVGAGIEFL